MREYHKGQAAHFHQLAQTARADQKRLKAERRFVDAFKAEQRAAEYRRTRDYHKAKAKDAK